MRVLYGLTSIFFLLAAMLGLLLVAISDLLPLFLLVLAVMLTLSFVAFMIYRAPEDTVSIVYRAGFVHRTIQPGQITLLLPFIERVRQNISRRRRRVDLYARDVYTRDRYPVNVHVQLIYRVDASQTQHQLWPQFRHLGDTRWNEIIRITGSALLPQIIGSLTFEELIPGGWGVLGSRLHDALRQSGLSQWGIEILSIAVRDVRPGRKLEPILQEARAANAEASALNTRLQALREVLGDNGDGIAMQNLLALALAGQVIRSGAPLPPILMQMTHGHPDQLAQTLMALLLATHEQRGSLESALSPGGDGKGTTSGSSLHWRQKDT